MSVAVRRYFASNISSKGLYPDYVQRVQEQQTNLRQAFIYRSPNYRLEKNLFPWQRLFEACVKPYSKEGISGLSRGAKDTFMKQALYWVLSDGAGVHFVPNTAPYSPIGVTGMLMPSLHGLVQGSSHLPHPQVPAFDYLSEPAGVLTIMEAQRLMRLYDQLWPASNPVLGINWSILSNLLGTQRFSQTILALHAQIVPTGLTNSIQKISSPIEAWDLMAQNHKGDLKDLRACWALLYGAELEKIYAGELQRRLDQQGLAAMGSIESVDTTQLGLQIRFKHSFEEMLAEDIAAVYRQVFGILNKMGRDISDLWTDAIPWSKVHSVYETANPSHSDFMAYRGFTEQITGESGSLNSLPQSLEVALRLGIPADTVRALWGQYGTKREIAERFPFGLAATTYWENLLEGSRLVIRVPGEQGSGGVVEAGGVLLIRNNQKPTSKQSRMFREDNRHLLEARMSQEPNMTLVGYGLD